MRVKLYALVDPRTDLVQYVGQTTQEIEARKKQHKWGASCASWYGELETLELEPVVVLIDEVPMDEWRWRERDMVGAFPSLLNQYSGGGGGGFRWSPTRHEYDVKRGRDERDSKRLVPLEDWEESQDAMAESVIRGQTHTSSMGWGPYSDVD